MDEPTLPYAVLKRAHVPRTRSSPRPLGLYSAIPPESYSQGASGWNPWIQASTTMDMSSWSPQDAVDERDLADVTAFADGSLPEERRGEVAARIAASPALARALERQRAVLSARSEER